MSKWRSKCCKAKIQLGRPDNEKWECSKCHKLCEYEYHCIFPDKITMNKILSWYKKLKKEGCFYEFKHINKPIKREVKK